MSKVDRLFKRLHAEVADPYMGDIGVRVWDLEAQDEIFSYNAGKSYMMASTAKIFTTGAALSLLGKDFRMYTEIYGPEKPSSEGVIDGDLYIKGAGDPSLGSPRYVSRFFYGKGTGGERVLEVLRQAGVRRVEGAVVADALAFDDRVKPTGRLSALTYDRIQAEEPALAAAREITEMLVQGGIEIAGPARCEQLPANFRLLGSIASPTLGELVIPMGRRSDNFIAETVGKLLALHIGGTRGSTDTGAEIVTNFVAGIGIAIEQVDGSGLAFRNKATPYAVVEYLKAMLTQPYAGNFMESLPVMGVHGTVHDRARNTAAQGNVRAKTGTHLTPEANQKERGFRSSALSGYCMVRSDQRLVFSIMQERPKSRYSALAGQERIVSTLAEYALS